LIQADIAANRPIDVWQDKRQEIWWRNVLSGNDQLRQRVAYALSQILVVSDQNGALEGNPTTLAHWHDMLASGAFGSYRTLLENVTLHPSMGHYLSMFGNRKPDAALNIRPDENYAREITQLFSVGLVMLNADGTPVDGNPAQAGVQPVPTYNQDTIRGFAHVFTGWKYSTCIPPNTTSADPNNNLNWWNWEYCSSQAQSVSGDQDWRLHEGWRTPLRPWGEGNTVRGEVYYAHEGTKQLLNYPGVSLPNGVLPSSSGRTAGSRARHDLGLALDNVFNHPNVGPFIARQLIQRLVSSNPSPAYIGRVAAAFADDNGAAAGGTRGNLRAVVRAVLMDPEARNLAQVPANGGKLREPLLRVSALWRALDARSRDGRIREGWPEVYGAQVVAHLARLVAAAIEVPVAELALPVVPPALHAAVVEDGAHVLVPGTDGFGLAPGSEVDGGEVGAHLVGVVAPVSSVPLAKLAEIVRAPALDAPVVQDGAREVKAE